jgi:hypothetical protein
MLGYKLNHARLLELKSSGMVSLVYARHIGCIGLMIIELISVGVSVLGLAVDTP